MLTLKMLAFNIMSLPQLYEALGVTKAGRAAPYWSSIGTDLSLLSAAIQIPAEQLRRSFFDEIAVNANMSHTHVIRHCSECIRQRYHSVLFDFAIFSHCPIHGNPLHVCRVCSNVLPSRCKLKKSETSDSYCLKLPCGHFNFDSSVTPCEPPTQVSGLVQHIGVLEDCVHWLRRCSDPFMSELTAPYVIDEDSSPQREEMSKRRVLCYRYAVERLGKFPSSIQDILDLAPRQTLSVLAGPPVKLSAKKNLGVIESCSLISLRKSIRRHIFKVYVKPHHRCWRQLSRLDRGRLYALDLASVCTACCAYRAWRYSLQWQTGGDKSIPAEPNLVGAGGTKYPADLNSITRFWLIHFYTIWYSLEHAYVQCAEADVRYSAKVTVRINTSEPPLRLGENALVQFNYLGLDSQTVEIAYFNPAETAAASIARCLLRPAEDTFVAHDRDPGLAEVLLSEKVLMKFWRQGAHYFAGPPTLKFFVNIG